MNHTTFKKCYRSKHQQIAHRCNVTVSTPEVIITVLLRFGVMTGLMISTCSQLCFICTVYVCFLLYTVSVSSRTPHYIPRPFFFSLTHIPSRELQTFSSNKANVFRHNVQASTPTSKSDSSLGLLFKTVWATFFQCSEADVS